MPADLLPMLSVTALPSAVLLAVAYPLRPQGGTRWLSPRAVPASEILARLRAEVEGGELPADPWGGVNRPHVWTVQPSKELVPVSVVRQARELLGLEVAA